MIGKLKSPEFDEEFYLRLYPDVAKAVELGTFASGKAHYEKHGRREGRIATPRQQAFDTDQTTETTDPLPPSKTPVAYFFFNRPELMEVTFPRIEAYQPRRLFLIADAARSDGERATVAAARAIVEKITWDCEVDRVYATENMGCKARLVSGLRYVFEAVQEAIIIEDDVLAHPDFFEFCHTMLTAFRNNRRVMHISGSSFLPPGMAEPPCWFSRHSDIWGWATWRRAFRAYDADLATWRRAPLWINGWLGDTLYERKYWAEHFDRIKAGEVDTWDYQWHYTVFRRGGVSVVPYANLITNLGHGANATHTRDESSGIARLKAFQIGPVQAPERVVRNRQYDEITFLRRYVMDCMPRLPVMEMEAIEAPPKTEDLVICHNEISDRHGVGALLNKLLRTNESWSYVRTTTHFERLGTSRYALELPEGEPEGLRERSYAEMVDVLRGRKIRRILCVPYAPAEAWRALAAAHITGAPLTVYLMDDQNLFANGLPDELVKILLNHAERRFAICHEMAEAYAGKYGVPISPLYPALENNGRPLQDCKQPPARKPQIVLIGNMWTSSWIRRFAKVVREAELHVDWFGNASGVFRSVSEDELSDSGVHLKGFLPADEMLATIQRYDLAVVPTASAADDPSHAWMAKLSFPSKMMTLVFEGGLPVVVLADEPNPASRFVREYHFGEVCQYDGSELLLAVNTLMSIPWLERFRANLMKAQPEFCVERAKMLLGLPTASRTRQDAPGLCEEDELPAYQKAK